jgi:hypothetical protein
MACFPCVLACSKINASTLSSDIEVRIAVRVRSTFEKIRSGSHDETGSVARILRSANIFGNTGLWHAFRAAIAVSSFELNDAVFPSQKKNEFFQFLPHWCWLPVFPVVWQQQSPEIISLRRH